MSKGWIRIWREALEFKVVGLIRIKLNKWNVYLMVDYSKTMRFKKWSFSSGSTVSEGGESANDVPIEVE